MTVMTSRRVWQLKRRRRLENWLRVLFEAIAIFAILSAVYVQFANRQFLSGAVIGTQAEDRIAQEEVAPRSMLLRLSEVVAHCADHDFADSKGAQTAIRNAQDIESFKGTYEILYRTEVDYTRISRKSFRRGANDHVGQQSLERWSSCFASNLFRSDDGPEKGGVLTEANKLDSRIHWAYMLVRHRESFEFAIWPDSYIPDGFTPWERPWYIENVSANPKAIHAIEYADRQGRVYETHPYADAFTKDHVLSLVVPLSDSSYGSTYGPGIEVLVAVDVRIDNQDVYVRALLLNFFISVVFALIAAPGRESKKPFLRPWYRAWLTMAVLYSVQIIYYFASPETLMFHWWQERGATVICAISILNNYFMLFTALYLFERRVRPRLRRSLLLGTISLVFIAVFLDAYLETRLFPVSPAEIVEALYSMTSLALLGYALSSVLAESMKGGYKKSRVLSNLAVSGVFVLFLLQGTLQLTIPLWPLSPFIEEGFWLLSIPAKVTEFFAFYIVILFVLYWKRAQLNDLFVDCLRKGVIASDLDFRVVNINSLAAQKLNLPGPFVEGKDLRQVLFSSLFEAESLFERIRSGEQIENVEIEGKHFPDGKEDLETITIRSMIISCYPAVSEFDDSSLVVVVLS